MAGEIFCSVFKNRSGVRGLRIVPLYWRHNRITKDTFLCYILLYKILYRSRVPNF